MVYRVKTILTLFGIGIAADTLQKVKRLSIKLTEISKQLQHFNIILILIKDYVIVL